MSHYLRAATAGVLFAASLCLFGAASPASANYVAFGGDPKADATDPDPGRDIVKVGLSYNRRTGHLQGGVMLRGKMNASAPANLTIFAGNRTASGCNGYPAIGFGTRTDLEAADWALLTGPGAPQARGPAKKVYSDIAEEYEATARPLAGKRPDCIIAQLNQPDDTSVVYDVAGPFRLKGLPELALKLGRLPSKFLPGRTRQVRVRIQNRGDGPTGRIRLSTAGARGMKVRMQRRISSVRPGRHRVVRMRVTLSRRALTWTNLRVTATAGKHSRARARGRLFLKKPSRHSGSGDGSSNQGGLKFCFRYTWYPPFGEMQYC